MRTALNNAAAPSAQRHSCVLVDCRKLNTRSGNFSNAADLRRSLLSLCDQNPPPTNINVKIADCSGSYHAFHIDEIEYIRSQFPNIVIDYNISEWPANTGVEDVRRQMSFSHRFILVAGESLPSEALDVSSQPNTAELESQRPPLSEGTVVTEENAPFSVLLPVYGNDNPEHFNQALLSIYAQSLPPEEVVIPVDGPLSSGLVQILSDWSHIAQMGQLPFKLKIVNPEWPQVRTLPVALNEGLQHCTQPFVARMDSDDICGPHRFLEQWRTIKASEAKGRRPAIVATSAHHFEENPLDPYATIVLPEYPEAAAHHLVRMNTIHHPSVVFDRELVMGLGGYDESFKRGQSNNLWFRMLEAGGTILSVQQPHVFMRGTPAQSARRKAASRYFEQNLHRSREKGWITCEEAQTILKHRTAMFESPEARVTHWRQGLHIPQSEPLILSPLVLQNRRVSCATIAIQSSYAMQAIDVRELSF